MTDVTLALRKMLEGIEELTPGQIILLEDEMSDIDRAHQRVIDERDTAEEKAGAVPDEDDIENEVRREIAAELEPLFGAIFRGDMTDAKARVGFLPAVLKGDDPILSAYYRAKARPTLFAA